MANASRGTAHNVLRYERNPLDPIFTPRSVAVFGATERESSKGRILLQNLLASSFDGKLFPINPKYQAVLGVEAFATIADVPDAVDLAIIATPPRTLPGIIGDCVKAGVRGAIVVADGFQEMGAEGAVLEAEALAKAREGNLRLIGPNSLGIMNPGSDLNATYATAMAQPGSVGFISQSGALCTAVLDWSFRENVGFSAFISVGAMIDVDWGDLIYYLGDDLSTKAIVIYMETIGAARNFLSAAREVALTKPIIVIKPGRTAAAAQAAASHTGALIAPDAIAAAAFRRCGVLRVDTIDDLFNMAEILAKQPRPLGPRLTVVTNAGGPGVLAADALIAGGGELASLSAETLTKLDDLLPASWSQSNPIDVLGDADPDRYAEALAIAAAEPESDGLLVVLTPQAGTDATETAERLKEMFGRPAAYPFAKPVLASWMGGASVAAGESILNQANIPTFPFPDTAARVFNYMWRYNRRLKSLYETPHLPQATAEIAEKRTAVSAMIGRARQAGRTLLTEYESKQILAAYSIPAVETRLAETAEAAVAAAAAIGYPVVVKLNSKTITHKSEVGGVRLDVGTAVAVRQAFAEIAQAVQAQYGDGHFLGVTVQPMMNLRAGLELIVGSSPDAQFGPVLLFGAGGVLVDVLPDQVLGLPPLNTTLARRMMERTRIYRALAAGEGPGPVDTNALEELMVLFSHLVVEQRWIKEIEINPLLATATGLVALDARVVLYEKEMAVTELPPLAIRPYPTQYIKPFVDKTGEQVIIRPIRPEDEPMMVEFHRGLSEESVYLRYFRSFQLDQRVEHERLTRVCFVDYDRDMALVVERQRPDGDGGEIIAAGRLTRLPQQDEAEFALLVSDAFQGRGLGLAMLRHLLEIGRHEGVVRVIAYMLGANKGMRAICKKLGFTFTREADLIKASIALNAENDD